MHEPDTINVCRTCQPIKLKLGLEYRRGSVTHSKSGLGQNGVGYSLGIGVQGRQVVISKWLGSVKSQYRNGDRRFTSSGALSFTCQHSGAQRTVTITCYMGGRNRYSAGMIHASAYDALLLWTPEFTRRPVGFPRPPFRGRSFSS